MSPAATARGSLGNLPIEVTSFVGRRHEVTWVRRLLSTTRLVTLTGPGGVGKTRLARRVSDELRRAFPDGVWMVEITEVSDPALLAVTVAETLGIRDESVRVDARRLAELLGDRHALLVLDNCEHLVAACAELADTLLRQCEQLRILATSRQALRIEGEATLTVHPLAVPDPQVPVTPASLASCESTALFVDRAGAVLPGFAVTEQNYATIAELCRALEGMPLAIELAAARLRVLSLDQILDRLTDRYQLLTSGLRGAPARQQTLRALIDWSWELCSEPERRLWARLSVFSGGLQLDAAEAVCSGGELPRESILDLISSLVDKSILFRTDEGPNVRYRLLEVIREYGAARLTDAGELAALRRRHCEWYADLAARTDAHWISREQADMMRRLRSEHANLRAALEFAIAEGPPHTALRLAADLQNHWILRGFMAEGRLWLDRALASGAPRHWTRVKALRVNAWICGVQGDAALAHTMLDEANALLDELPVTDDLVYIVTEKVYLPIVRGTIVMFNGDITGALPMFEKAVENALALGGPGGQMWAYSVLGIARGLTDTPSSGYGDLFAAQEIAEAHGELWWCSFALWALSVLRWRDGDLAGATADAKRSLELRQVMVEEQFGYGLSLESLAWIAGSEGRNERAALLLGASQRRWRAMQTSLFVFRRLRDFHDEIVARVRGRMGPAAFEATVRRGAELSRQEALELALESRPRSGAATQRHDDTLTRRERQVAALVAEGLSNREIAARLVVAQRTAEGHVEHILSKLGFSSRAQVAAWMAEQRSLPGNGPTG